MSESLARKELLGILACPACEDRPKVALKDGALHCPGCGRAYPIENGLPIMLVERATMEPSTEEEQPA